MTEEEQRSSEEAERYIKTHEQELILRFADPKIYRPVEHPISLFMAGSPGAGKTEVSKRLIREFSEKPPVRIDADDIRNLFPNYTGANSQIFQRACTVGVNKLFDHVIADDINVILDGTFAYTGVEQNIIRSLKHKRYVVIYYLFQDPLIAWEFTKIREEKEGRAVPKETFINAFIMARENVNRMKAQFGSNVELKMIIKDYKAGIEQAFPNVDTVDTYLPRVYSREELDKLLC